ncbi:MAG TPA: hypothetical protein VEB18_02740 [Candidatus Paceibacterota bacterium]|nr:hypothetical protein [Candidatus Paceibacterota bacterium]
MIVDFPEPKKQIKKLLDQVLRQKVKQKAPTMSLGSRKTIFEGTVLSVIQADGTREESEMRAAESTFVISREQIPNTSMTDMIEKIDAAAHDMAGQIERDLFETLKAAIQKSGNTIPGNPPLSPDAILTMLEKMAVDFEDDDRSKPVRPTIIASPEAFEAFQKINAETTPEERAVYDERERVIMDKKYAEYMTDVESRKLID